MLAYIPTTFNAILTILQMKLYILELYRKLILLHQYGGRIDTVRLNVLKIKDKITSDLMCHVLISGRNNRN